MTKKNEIDTIKISTIKIGAGEKNHSIAILHRHAELKAKSNEKPAGLFWLGGFKSDMLGSKAIYLDDLGKHQGLEVTRFDYSGHGQSGGEFIDGTISNWLEEALEVFATTKGEQIIIGSSMGGWLALLLNRALIKSGQARVRAIILIAPAIDMSKDLMSDKFTQSQLNELEKNGYIEQPSDYDEPYIITKKLIDDGKQHLLFSEGSIKTNCPVHIIQGGLDDAVPPAHALKLMSHLTMDEVVFTLIPDGGHSLSRAQDLDKLGEVILSFLSDK